MNENAYSSEVAADAL